MLCQRRLCGLLHYQMQACLHMLIRVLLTLDLLPPVLTHTYLREHVSPPLIATLKVIQALGYPPCSPCGYHYFSISDSSSDCHLQRAALLSYFVSFLCALRRCLLSVQSP